MHFRRHQFGRDVELHVDLWGFRPLEHVGRVGVFDREVFHIVRDDPDRRHGIGPIGLGIAACSIEIGEHAFFVGHGISVFQFG